MLRGKYRGSANVLITSINWISKGLSTVTQMENSKVGRIGDSAVILKSVRLRVSVGGNIFTFIIMFVKVHSIFSFNLLLSIFINSS